MTDLERMTDRPSCPLHSPTVAPEPCSHRSDEPTARTPLGLVIAKTAKAIDRAFDDALVAAGGNRPTWLILLAVKSGAGAIQNTLADQVGISSPTLIYHLDRLESSGVVRRVRGLQNRRVQAIELTDAGHDLFLELREAAEHFDDRLRTGFDEPDVITLVENLHRVSANVAGPRSVR